MVKNQIQNANLLIASDEVAWGWVWSCIGLALVLLGLTWPHLDSLGLTWSHLDSLGLTGSHLDLLNSLGLT